MQYRFTRNLGLLDADFLRTAFAAGLDYRECTTGEVVDVPEKAAAWLNENRRGLLEVVEPVKGVAKKSEIVAPAK